MTRTLESLLSACQRQIATGSWWEKSRATGLVVTNYCNKSAKALVVIISGAGKWSIDRLLAGRLDVRLAAFPRRRDVNFHPDVPALSDPDGFRFHTWLKELISSAAWPEVFGNVARN